MNLDVPIRKQDMALAVVAIDGVQIDELPAERPLMTMLLRHRRVREQVECLCRRLVELETEGRLAARLENRLNELFAQEQYARDEMLRFPVESLEDCAAKVDHLRWLLKGGESGLDDTDWAVVLQSFPVDIRGRGHASIA